MGGVRAASALPFLPSLPVEVGPLDPARVWGSAYGKGAQPVPRAVQRIAVAVGYAKTTFTEENAHR